MLKSKKTDIYLGGVNMEKKTWKTIAIVFIILFFLETIIFVSLATYGVKEINRETQCAVECDNENECSSYYYDTYTQKCKLYRYSENGIELYRSKIIN